VKEHLGQGFVINGKNAGDWSGTSVSTAGDVNGDGLDDLIVGAHNADQELLMIYIVVGSHNITLLDGLPTEIIKKNASLCI
jgi:hypothetical protein